MLIIFYIDKQYILHEVIHEVSNVVKQYRVNFMLIRLTIFLKQTL